MTGRPRSIFHPLAGARFVDLCRTLLAHGGFSRRYALEVAIMLGGAVLRAPICWVERWRVERRVAAVTFDPPPLFIVGHWRSGTTYLHNLLCSDPAFVYPTIVDALRPYDFFPSPIEPISREFLIRNLPPTRPMDDMPMSPDLPQEEELALANMGAPSFFNCLYFPRAMSEIFAREVLFEGSPPDDGRRWRRSLRYYLAKLVLLAKGRRLLLKNPAHSAHIGQVRELFPGAKFIHIHRDPIEVFVSTCKLYRRTLPLVALQPYEDDAVERHVLWSYRRVMDALLPALADLPPGEKVEVRYDELVQNPLGTIERIYDTLMLGDFAGARPLAAAAVIGPTGKRTRRENVEKELGADIVENLAPYLTRLGYARDTPAVERVA